MRIVVDNDVLYKTLCYGIAATIVVPLVGSGEPIGVLSAARYVVRRKIELSCLSRPHADLWRDFATVFAGAHLLDPTKVELDMAADFERVAQVRGLSLDVGESQLCAIVVQRDVPTMLTGDKRAIESLEQLFDDDLRLQGLRSKVRCLEQLIVEVLSDVDVFPRLHNAICADRSVDNALTICFSCYGGDGQLESTLEGLDNYIADLRSRAARVLAH